MVHGLYAILDVPHARGLAPVDVVKALLGDKLEGGVDGACAIQLRAKHADTDERVELLRSIAPLCQRARVPLIVNDDVEALFRAGGCVQGVHLGQDDAGADEVAALRRAAARSVIVGLSTHTPAQLRDACRREPDYVACGPVAATRSKANPEAVVGFDGLLEACRKTSRPLVAIGGLDRSGAVRAVEFGANAVAAIAALVHDTPAAVREHTIALAAALRRAAQPLPFDEVCRRVPVLDASTLTQLAAWSDDVGVLIELGLPARFRPRMMQGLPQYRPSDVCDLWYALGKRPDEDWERWERRIQAGDAPALVQLRARPSPPLRN